MDEMPDAARTDKDRDQNDLRVRVAALAQDYRTRATRLRRLKGAGRDAGQDEYEYRREAARCEAVAAELDALLADHPAP